MEREETWPCSHGKWHPVAGPRNTGGGHESWIRPTKRRSLFKDTLSTGGGLSIRNSPEGPTDPSLRKASGTSCGEDHSASNLALSSECLPFHSDNHGKTWRHSDNDDVGRRMSVASWKCHGDRTDDRLDSHVGRKDSNEHSESNPLFE